MAFIFAQSPPTSTIDSDNESTLIEENAPEIAESTAEGGQEILNAISSGLKDAFLEMGNAAIAALPNIIIALVLFVIGICVAKILKSVFTRTFQRIKLDEIFDKVGLGEVLTKLGLTKGPSIILPKLISWLVIMAFIKVAADHANFENVSNLLDQIIAFLPRVVTASIILLVGFVASNFIQNATFRSMDALGLEYASSLSRILFGFIFVLVLTVAFSQLGIETELLNSSVKILLGGLALAFALALGLGLKTLASHIVAGVYSRDLYRIGTEIHYDDKPAKVAGVGPLTTKLTRDDGSFIIIPNSHLVNQVIKGRTEN